MVVALSVAAGTRKNALTLSDALRELIHGPLGLVFVSAIAVGMMCFALWRIAQGFLDADNLGTGPRAAVRRAGSGLSSMAYFGIAAIAAGIALRLPSWTSTSSTKNWASWLLGLPLGSVALGLIGAGFLGAGASDFRGPPGDA